MIADQNFNDTCFAIIYPTASATVYGRRPKFFMAEHSATAEGENRAYGPTLLHTMEDDIKNVSDFVVLGTKLQERNLYSEFSITLEDV